MFQIQRPWPWKYEALALALKNKSLALAMASSAKAMFNKVLYCRSVSQQNIRSNYLHAFDFVNKVESIVCVVRLDFMPSYSNIRP